MSLHKNVVTLVDIVASLVKESLITFGGEKMSKYIAIYARVSSGKQDLRSQLPDLERWTEAQNQPIRWFKDKASGKSMDRKGWQKLQNEMGSGNVSKLVVWRMDRLGRTAAGLTALFEELQLRKIGFESLRDRVDLSTPSGRLMACVLASVAAYENEVRSERVLAGQAVARANGKTWGGSRKGRRLSVSEEQVTQVRRLRSEGVAVAAIARAVSLSRPTIYRLLKEQVRA